MILALADGMVVAQAPQRQGSTAVPDPLEISSPRLAHRAVAPEPLLPPTQTTDAAPGSPLTREELQSIALECNPAFRQARARIEAAQGKWIQAGLPPNPVAGYSGEDIGEAGRAGKQGFFVSQEWVTGGKLQLDRAIACHEIEQARQQWLAAQQRVLNDAAMAFYDALAAQQGLALAEQVNRIGEEGLRATEQLLAAKEVSRVDLLQARVEAASASLQRDTAASRHQEAWRRLAAIVGRPDLPPGPLAGSLEADLTALSWESVLTRLLAQSPELARARAAAERARCVVARQQAERIPNLLLQAAVQHDNSNGDDVARVEMGLPLPIFNRNQGNIARAQAEWAAAQDEVRRVELGLQERLAPIFFRYAAAQREAEVYRERILADAKSSLDLLAIGYRQGEIGYLALLTAQRTYFSAATAYLENLRQAQTNRVALEGLLLRGGLNAATAPDQVD